MMEKISLKKLKSILEGRDDRELEKKVVSILAQVRENGDEALKRFTEKFDGVKSDNIKVSAKELAAAGRIMDKSIMESVSHTAKRIEKYHAEQMPASFTLREKGMSSEFISAPVAKAAIYIPAGQAPLVSTVLMTAIPAQVAGVKNIYAASPPSCNGKIHPLILGVLHSLGIRDVFAMGGAQSIAAFAYGTETVPSVDVIAGPGNRYVDAAKRMLYGKVGLDMQAGPSELAVFSDGSGRMDFMEADLKAQIEHAGGLGILITTCEKTGRDLSRRVKGGYWLKANSRKEAVQIINYIAPEHLQVMCRNSRGIAGAAVAGAVFIGDWSPAALGDYFAGPSHVLPTGRAARFASGISVYTFLRSYAVVEAEAGFYRQYGELMEVLPQAEGLPLHRASIGIRRREAKR